VLIYSAGLRLGELLNLKIEDINSDSMKIHVRQSVLLCLNCHLYFQPQQYTIGIYRPGDQPEF